MHVFRKILILCLLSIPLSFCTVESPYAIFLGSESANSASIENEFYIRLDMDVFRNSGRSRILYELSDRDNFGLTNCGINEEEEGDQIQDRYCILDINELDLLGIADGDIPLTLEYNVPRETCSYTAFHIPWHFNQPIGVGPSFVTKCTYEPEDSSGEGEGNNESSTICVKKAETLSEANTDRSTCASGNAITVNGANNPCAEGWIEESEDEGEGDFIAQQFCTYNAPNGKQSYDLSDGGLANCCIGKYNLISCEHGGTCAEPEDNNWGGDLGECIGGPARVSDWDAQFEIEGYGSYPIPQIFNTWERGLNDVFEIEKPIIIDPLSIRSTRNLRTHPRYFSIGLVNYYDGIESFNWNSSSASQIPQIFKTKEEVNGAQLLGYPYFTLECLNPNKEALYSVHLIIREWNTLNQFLLYQESSGGAGDPDYSGQEGDECEYYQPDEFKDNDCNDLYDIDDLMANPRAGCDAYPCVDYEEGGGG